MGRAHAGASKLTFLLCAFPVGQLAMVGTAPRLESVTTVVDSSHSTQHLLKTVTDTTTRKFCLCARTRFPFMKAKHVLTKILHPGVTYSSALDYSPPSESQFAASVASPDCSSTPKLSFIFLDVAVAKRGHGHFCWAAAMTPSMGLFLPKYSRPSFPLVM